MTKTDIFCKGLRYSGLLAGKAMELHFGSSSNLRVLAYHRVLDSVPDNFVFDCEVISCSSKEFRREMEFVAKNFDVITFRDIVENGADYYRRPLVVTFDDGYKDNHDIVLPILEDVGIPAVFFVTTDYIDGRNIPWWDEIAFLMAENILPLQGKDISEILGYCKSISDDERIRFLGKLRTDAKNIPPVHLMMDWGDVRGLNDAGMEIGSHTVSHPMLRNITDKAKLVKELRESKRKIEKEIGGQVYSFSYPVGRASSADDDIVDAVKDAGYKFACLYEHGVNRKDDFDVYRLLRIKTEVGDDFERFMAKVLFPRIVKY